MAYKYQRGLQVSSGSLHVEHDLTGSGNNILGQANTAVHRAYGTLDLSDADGASYGLKLGGTLVTSTAAELNFADGAKVGEKVASKAAIYSSSGSLNTWGLAVVDGAYDLKIASHDGSSNGLVLGSTLVTATGAELNYLDNADLTAADITKLAALTATAVELNYSDGISLGTGSASTVLSLDANRSVTNILNLTSSFISASAAGGFIGDGSALTNISMDEMALVRGYIWIGDSEGEAGQVDAKGSAKILVGDGTDVNSVSISGDVTISTAGAVTIASNAVETVMIKNNAVTMASMATGSLENNAYATGSLENAHLAGAIANAKLSNSAVTLSQGAGMASMGSVSLGGSVTVAVDGNLEDLDTLGAVSSNGEMIVGTGAGAYAYESGATLRTSIGVGTGDTLTLAGLSVTGNATLGNSGEDTVSVDAGQLNISSGIAYENIKYKNENYTVSAGDYLINCGAGNTLTLPAVGTLEDGTVFVIKNGDGDASASSAVTIDGNGAETIDGTTTILLESPYAAVTVMVSGSGWLVL